MTSENIFEFSEYLCIHKTNILHGNDEAQYFGL